LSENVFEGPTPLKIMKCIRHTRVAFVRILAFKTLSIKE